MHAGLSVDRALAHISQSESETIVFAAFLLLGHHEIRWDDPRQILDPRAFVWWFVDWHQTAAATRFVGRLYG